MLYDVFICHASADKASLVRPLVDALREEHIEVWFDERTLKLGDSLRRAIDKGLTKSRFAVVVLSKAFFARNWPQYELDALTEREMAGNDTVILQVWHGVTHQDVIAYSPALAGRKAISSSEGLRNVVREIHSVVHPQESPLIVARDELLEWGVTPPVITDHYWLDVVEASNRIPCFGASVPEESSWRRWSFPLPPKEGDSRSWGERLAWTAMQMAWVKDAEARPITPLTPANEVMEFIHLHAGLFTTCSIFPSLLVEYAPQLSIPGFGGELEDRIEEEFQKCPNEGEWSLRWIDFEKYPERIALCYFHSGMFGPEVSPYEDKEHAFWLLSKASAWLPAKVRSVLLLGMKNRPTWLWYAPKGGALSDAIHSIIRQKQTGKQFKWDTAVEDDVRAHARKCIELLRLPETDEELFRRFKAEKFPQFYIKATQQRNLERETSAHKSQKIKPK